MLTKQCIGAGDRPFLTWTITRASPVIVSGRLLEIPVRLSVNLVWYNGMGGHPAISYAGDFLLLDGYNSYGSGIETIEFYPHIPSSHRAQSLEMLHARFDERVRKLPKSWIKRKLRRIEIAYNSELGTQEELVGEQELEFPPSRFSLACHEIVLALKIVESKIKPSDDIHWTELKSHFALRLKHLPKTEIELQTILQQLRLEAHKRLLP